MTHEESRTLDAALARIVPADGLLARPFVLGRAALQSDAYRAGLALLSARGFADLATADQDAVLTELEGHPFLNLLVQHTMEGYYTSPEGLAAVGFRVTA